MIFLYFLLQKNLMPDNPFEYGLLGFFVVMFSTFVYFIMKSYNNRLDEELKQKQRELIHHQQVEDEYRSFLQESNINLSKVIEGNTAAFHAYNKVLTELAAQIKVQNEILQRKWFYLNFNERNQNKNK